MGRRACQGVRSGKHNTGRLCPTVSFGGGAVLVLGRAAVAAASVNHSSRLCRRFP